MELNRHICTQLIEKAKSFSQITMDDDYIVRDNKPDVVRVIYSKGNVLVEDVKAGNQGLWITGKLHFSVLYQSDDENHRLESVNGEVPFQEKIVMDEVEDGDDVTVDMEIEDLSVGIINSRKLAIRAVINVMARNLEEEDLGFVCGIFEPGYEQKEMEVSMLCLVENAKNQLRMQKELLLPNARSNIGQLTFYQVDFRNEEIILQDDTALVKMDAQVWVLYRSESTGEYECYETTVPLSGEIDVNTLRGDEIFWAKIVPLEVEVEPRGDYDGENRMLGFDMIFSVEIQIYREENCQVLQDAYALDKELLMERESVPISQLLMKNVSKIRLMEQEQLEVNQQKILQICGSSGNVTIDRVQKRENGIQVEGVLNVHILYNTAEDAMPYAHTSSHIPFEQFVEVDGFSESSHYWMSSSIEQLQVNLLDNSEYEVKALIQISILALNHDYISNIVDIEEEPLDMGALEKQPGMIGYVRREGEDLWDVAKKYHATTDNMIEIGNKVLVVKQVR
ncbi:MAG: DUF3794 domain-containing protein [Agathobacter sp.]|nr:DUF3794 domain-containing protein [Agathobacter sp.]